MNQPKSNMPRLFKIYRSSAGSGKTFTLTKEYLKLALAAPYYKHSFKPDYFRHILAITFTNFAANEMKERILTALTEMADGKRTPLFEAIYAEITQEYPHPPYAPLNPDDLLARAKDVHQYLLHRYTDFSVSTIDAFSQRIVQSFRRELKLPYHYALELDSDELLEQATDLLQQNIGENTATKALSDIMVEYAIAQSDENKSWFIEKNLYEFGKNLFNETKYDIIQQLNIQEVEQFQKVRDEVYAYLKALEKRFSELGKEAIQKIEQEGLQPQDLSYGDKGIYQLFNHAANNDLSNLFSKDYKNAQKTLDEGKWEAAKATKKLSENLKHCLKQLGYSTLGLREKEKERYILAQELKKHLYQLATIHELQKSLQKVKEAENKIHISELNHKINEVITTEPIPFIFEKLGIRYHHILIDEFQDTSEKQWHNLLPLVINALNKQCASLVVGDAKQAIYRWRGGRADMLVDLPNVPTLPPDNVQLRQDVAVLQYEKNIQTLTVNRRSRANIIQFNNAFYEYVKQQYAAQHPDLLRYYAEVTQATTDKQGGQIDIVIFSEEVEDEQAITFEKILDYIAQIEQLGYQRSDIAILVRRNSDGFELAKAFMAAGISVVSSEVLRLLSAPTVAFIVNFFRLVAGSKDQKVAMRVASYVIQEKINLERQGEFLIKAAQAMAVSIETLVDFINQHVGTHFQLDGMRFLSLYEMAEELIRQLNLYEKPNEQMYIHKLLDEIQRFVNKKGNHLLDFLDYLERHAEEISITSPASPEAIQLMTIHKAKGLQFPVVILPFAEWLLKPTHWTKIWKKVPDSQKNLNFGLNAAILTTTEKLQETLFKGAYAEELHAHFLEALNIFYVATTRAEERIFILGKTSKKGSGTLTLLENFLNQNALPTKILQTNALYRHFRLFEDLSAPLCSPLVAKKEQELVLTSFLHTESRNFIRLKQNSLRNEDLMHHLSNFLSPLRQGLLMHYAFENVYYAEDISIAVQKLVSEGYITLQESGNLIEKMQRVVDIPLIRPYFEPKEGRNILNERFVLNGAETYRPDRLVIDRFADKKEVVIIDYKTGVYEKKYEVQLNRYAQLLNNMSYLVRKKILVFTEIPDAFEV